MDLIYGFWKGDKNSASENKKESEQNSGAETEKSSENDSQGVSASEPNPKTDEKLGEPKPNEAISKDSPVEPITLDEISAGGKAAQLQDVSQKAYESAKSIGSFLYKVAGNAGHKVTETAKHLKHTVEENTLLGEFNKEQEAFLKSKGSTGSGGVPPWSGCPDEDSLKLQILSLSQDKRNFVRSPPTGVNFDFNFEEISPVAMATLKEDKNLQTMRFELVPKMVSEENFWRNYFYRVSLVKQSNQLSSMSQERRGSSPDTDSRSSIDDSSDESQKAKKAAGLELDSPVETPSHSEFVSDTYGKNKVSQEEMQRGMKQLGLTNRTEEKEVREVAEEEEWEAELQHELREYEVVNEGALTSNDGQDTDWEKEVTDMLLLDQATPTATPPST